MKEKKFKVRGEDLHELDNFTLPEGMTKEDVDYIEGRVTPVVMILDVYFKQPKKTKEETENPKNNG